MRLNIENSGERYQERSEELLVRTVRPRTLSSSWARYGFLTEHLFQQGSSQPLPGTAKIQITYQYVNCCFDNTGIGISFKVAFKIIQRSPLVYKGIFKLSLIDHRSHITSPHVSVGRALDLKTRGCVFDSRAGQSNSYYLSFG